MPYVVGVLLGAGMFLTIRLGVVQLRRFPEAVRAMLAQRQSSGSDRRAVAVSGVHDGARGVDRHRQHRRRGDRDHLRRPWRAVLDLGLRLRRDGDQVHGGRARRQIPAGRWRPRSVRADVLPARRTAVAGARVDLRARRRRGGADDDAVHAAELDRRGGEHRVWRADAGSSASSSPCSPGP